MIEFPVSSPQPSPQPHHASQAAVFSAMLNNLSVDNMNSHTRSLLDCAAQAGNNQARNFGLVSLASSNTGEAGEMVESGLKFSVDVSGPLAAMATMTDMKAAAMLSQASTFSSPGTESGSAGEAPLSPSPPPTSSSSSTSLTSTSSNVVNPHGIDSILNRRTAAGLPPLSPSCLPATSSSADTNLSSTMSRFGLSNPYLGQSITTGGKFQDLVSQRAAAIYWPGIQGLMSNPTVWRDRFVLNSKSLYSLLNVTSLINS